MAVRPLPVLLAVAVLALPAGTSLAAKARTAVWATVNVCDTASAPNTIGIRGSMPGNGKRGTKMFMRFRVQYRNAKGVWKPATSLDTGFLPLGSGDVRSRESGHSFTLRPSSSGAASERYILRGLVTYQWRGSRGQVTRAVQRLTTAGHRSTVGADPAGYSAAVCNMIVP